MFWGIGLIGRSKRMRPSLFVPIQSYGFTACSGDGFRRRWSRRLPGVYVRKHRFVRRILCRVSPRIGSLIMTSVRPMPQLSNRPVSGADTPSQNCLPRILFVGESVSLAHIGRPALLARWARQAGCEVHFACGPRYASIAQAEGLQVHPLKTIPGKRFYERLNQGRVFY